MIIITVISLASIGIFIYIIVAIGFGFIIYKFYKLLEDYLKNRKDEQKWTIEKNLSLL